MPNLTTTQKEKLSQIWPELKGWFDIKDVQQSIDVLSKSIEDIKKQTAIVISKAIEDIKNTKPKDGYTPQKGTDYIDGIDYILSDEDKEEIAEIASSKIEVPIVEKVIEKTIVREKPIITEITKEVENKDTPKEIVKKLNTLENAIDISVIKGAVSEIDIEEIIKPFDKKILDGMARVDGRIKLIDQRWGSHGGGLSKVTTDATLSGLGTPSSPLTVVSSGGVGAWSAPPESPDGSNLIFTVGGSAPTDVEADGLLQFSPMYYNYSTGQITFINPPSYSVHFR